MSAPTDLTLRKLWSFNQIEHGTFRMRLIDLDKDGKLEVVAGNRYGAVEVWPIVHWNAPEQPTTGADWLALLLETADAVTVPGSYEWNAGVSRHAEFGAAVGAHVLGGAPLHPPSTATTVRVRDGEVVLTDGPFAEGAEVATGFYLLRAADRDEATKIASMIPATAVQVRRLVGVSLR